MGMVSEVFSPLFYDSVMSGKLFYEIFDLWHQVIVLLDVTVDFEVILGSSWAHVLTLSYSKYSKALCCQKTAFFSIVQ